MTKQEELEELKELLKTLLAVVGWGLALAAGIWVALANIP